MDIPAASAFLDSGDQLMREWELEFARLNEEVRNLGIWARNLEDLVQARDRLVHELQGELEDRNLWALRLEREVAARDEALRQLQEEFEGRTRWARELAGEVASRDERLGRTQAELDRVADHLAHIRHALPYRILCRLGILPK